MNIIEELETIRVTNMNAANEYAEILKVGGNPSNRMLAQSIEKIHDDLRTLAWALKRLIDPHSD